MRERSRRLILTPLALVIALALAACSSGPDQRASDVAGAIPWPGSESLSYVVKDRKGTELGKIVLAIETQGSNTKLSQRFEGPTTQDDSSVTVDARTLKPVSSSRDIVTAKDEEKIEVTYSQAGALIKQGDKQSGLSVPEHSYDNDSSLFLWRTLPFAEGYRASYVTIVTNQRSRQDVNLRVIGKESVRVAAGTFDAWKLEIKAAGVKQLAWYADTPTRTLVRYDNDNGLIYELARVP